MSASPAQPPLPIAVTMGDPAGIGPEICVDLLMRAAEFPDCAPLVFGDAEVLRAAAAAVGKPARWSSLPVAEWRAQPELLSTGGVVDFQAMDFLALHPGQVDAASGRAAVCYIEGAIAAVQAGLAAAVVTGPIHKTALRAAGLPHPGHTELFAERTGAQRVCMMLTSPDITCSLVTVHIGLDAVAAALSRERILEVIELTADAMRRLRGREPRLAVLGLNPHAGEAGLIGGGEEETHILPAVEAARAQGLQVEGPLPPDTAFLPARRARTDAYVCMYHDQGLIPLKMLAFDSAVNTTLGLPLIRTSVDHGTALDIAWQGKAESASLFHAVRLAARLAASPGQ